MTIHNSEIAEIFSTLADLLEIANENPFRIRAYRNAARIINGLPKSAAEIIAEKNDLTGIPGIGDDLASKIQTIVKTGRLPLLNQMQKRIPAILTELLKIEGLGPKRVQRLYKECGVRSLSDLKKSIDSGRLHKLHGFGDKLVEKINSGLQHVSEYSKRIKLTDAFSVVDSVTKHLKKSSFIKQVVCAGSFRRKKETVGDLDFLVTASDSKKAIDHFLKFNEIDNVISQGNTRSTVRLHSGIQVDLRAVNPDSYGSALIYFTGSKAHNIAIRKMAMKKNLKINEYGVYKGDKKIAGKTEKEVYNQVGLAWIQPEMREDRGEIDLAKSDKLPLLIQLKNIKGDLHCHTNATDGNASLEDMVNKAKELGYQYIAITDHSKYLTITHGLTEKQILAQIKIIDKLNAKLQGIIILKSMEVDILENGELDMPNNILKELDFTVCSVHSKFNLSKHKQTKRVIRAMDNPYFTILGHPTGRLINRRVPYEIDMENIMQAAAERHRILELNAQPERMDLDDLHCKMAKELGIKLAISTDAHSTMQMNNMKFGIYQAQRGWIEAKDVINTYGLTELIKYFRK